MKSVIATSFAALGALAFAVLAGCTPGEQTAVTNLSDAVVPLAASFIPGAPPVLTATAALACAVQSVANANGDSTVSKVAGVACKW